MDAKTPTIDYKEYKASVTSGASDYNKFLLSPSFHTTVGSAMG